ncbi:hypothetical protein DdX_15977 [Ditylenchus destructor]|uniref:Uncharacterized protein n=1 Tax=Ditylenchus destructor TaxID=166010 RepID=A0AAD4MPV4_9BILA|nr:hypothetical protein DdX_15977 [Ditylenchus destructor]
MNSNVLLAFSGISLIFLLQTNFINADDGDEGPGGDDDPNEDGPGLDEGPPNPDPNIDDMNGLVGPDDSRMDDSSMDDDGSLPDSSPDDNSEEGPRHRGRGGPVNGNLTNKLKEMAKTLKKMGQGLANFLRTLGH